LRIWICFTAQAIFLVFLYIKLAFPELYLSLIQENSIIEYLQVMNYFLASVMAFLTARIFFRKKINLLAAAYFLLAFILLFVSFEEVSWGQFLFNISLPEFFSRNNAQGELTIHNLYFLQSKLSFIYILTGIYGAFAWIINFLFFSSKKTNFTKILNFIIPEWFLSPYFFFCFFIYFLFFFIHPGEDTFLLWRDQEIAELLLSSGFLFFCITKYITVKRLVLGGSANEKIL